MITLNNAVANELIFYLDATEDYFLFEFKSGLNCSPTYIIARNISECADYQQVIINHDFGFGGVWTVNIYEQASGSNTNTANAVLLTSEQAKIVVDTTCFNTPPVQINLCPEILPVNFSCEDLLTPYTGLDDEQIRCVLASLSCEYLRDALTYEQIECFGPPISEYTCDQLLEGLLESQISCIIQSSSCELLTDPYLGLTEEQQICVLQSLPCDIVADTYNGLTDEQLACVIPTISCDLLEANLTQTQIDCLVQLGYDVDYRAVLSYASAQGYTEPSNFQKVLQSDLMTNLKSAAVALSDYKLVRVYGNDIVHGVIPADLGFDGINWAEPGIYPPTRVNTIVKTTNQGYASNAVDGRIREGFNPSTGGIPSTDFLWFACYWYQATGGGGGIAESVFNAAFTQRMDMFFIPNPLTTSNQVLFGVLNPIQAFAAANTEPTFQTHILWRDGADLYIMINGTQYGPFNTGSDSGLMNQEFNSLVRSFATDNFFDYTDTAIRKTVFGFAQASNINKSLLHAALFNYHVNL